MKDKPDKQYMRAALKQAEMNIKKMQGGPFGACIVKANEILAVSRNTVLKHDATAHAEINAIRKACKKLNTFDLSGCVIYSTTEPCPMCFGAIHWAKIDVIIFGTAINDVKKLGFNELTIPNCKMKKWGKSKVRIFKYFLRQECSRLLKEWNKLAHKILY